jgi:hypothetical protein
VSNRVAPTIDEPTMRIHLNAAGAVHCDDIIGAWP